MAATIYDWSLTASLNSSADTDINWAEGQTPGSVNNSAREMMRKVKQLLGDIGGALSAGGSANVITVTANSGYTAYADGQILAFRATATNSGATTLNVNTIGAKSLRKMSGTTDIPLVGGEVVTGGIYAVYYSAAANSAAGGWMLTSPQPIGWEVISAQTLSSATSFAPPNLSPFRRLRIHGFIMPATDGVILIVRTSTNNGVSFDTGASDYLWQVLRATSSTVVATNSTATTRIALGSAGIGNASQQGISLNIEVNDFNVASNARVRFQAEYTDSAGASYTESGMGRRLQATARDSIAVQFSSGNIASGNLILEGLRG